MLPFDETECCTNCEHLRIDNFCLVKGKYVLTKNINKRRECQHFNLKIEIPSLKIKKNESHILLSQFLNKKMEKNEE